MRATLAWVSDRTPRLLAVCFLLYGIVFAAVFTSVMPPFQNADETSHFLRAAQVSRGQMVGIRRDGGDSGGPTDRGLMPAMRPFAALSFHPDVKASRGMYAAMEQGWTGQDEWQNFTNTAIYPPVFYLPAAAGLWIGRSLDLSILRSFYLARLGNALVAILLGGLGILAAGSAAPYIFAVLLLPMSLALMPNLSQDGPMIGCAALAAGLAGAAWQRRPRGSMFLPATTGLTLALLCMARPPYLPLAVLPLLLPARSRWPGVAATAAIALACIGWSVFADARVAVALRPDDPAIDPARQLRFVVAHPVDTIGAVTLSLRLEASTLLEQFIGRLGWLDTPLPPAYRTIAAWLLPVAALLAFDARPQYPALPRAGVALALAAAILASVVLMFLVEYAIWNEVGSPLIEGVQGRYFFPPALMAATLLALLPAAPRWWTPLRGALVAALALFPAVSIGIVIRAVVLRFYLA